jgi:hypothetical protein
MEQAEDVIARAGLMIVGAAGLDDLETAIGLLRRALRLAPAAVHGLHLLASALQTRYDLTGAPDDLEACNTHLTELLDGLPDGHPVRHETEAWLGLNLARGRDDERALLLLGRALRGVGHLPEETAGRVLWTLGRLLFARSGGRAGRDLDEAARLLARAAVHLPDDESLLRDVSDVLAAQWQHGDAAALDRLIVTRRALARLLPDSAIGSTALASALAERHALNGSPEDRDEAIKLISSAGKPDSALLILARLLASRALGSDGGDLDAALGLLARLADSPTLSAAELDTARRALETLQELRGADRELRGAYGELRDADGELRGVDPVLGPRPAVLALTDALSEMDRRDPLRTQLMIRLVVALCEVEPPNPLPYEKITKVTAGDDLGAVVHALVLIARGSDEGPARLSALVEDIPVTHRLRGPLVTVLGTRLAWRAEVLGDLEALDGADRYLAEAVHHTQSSVRLRVLHAVNKVTMARCRSLPDLVDEAIRDLESDLAALSSTDRWFPRGLWALGDAWVLRGRLRDIPADVLRGHRLVIEAQALAPASHPDQERLRAAADQAAAALRTAGA